jgi:type II secretory pathway component PulL
MLSASVESDLLQWDSSKLLKLYVNSGDTSDAERAIAILTVRLTESQLLHTETQARHTETQARYARRVALLTVALVVSTVIQAGVALFVSFRG